MAASITVTWNEKNSDEDAHWIYRSTSPFKRNGIPFTLSEMPEPIGTVGPNITEYVDSTVVEGTTYYYRVGAVRGDQVELSGELSAYAGYGPGTQTLQFGDASSDGFFGEVLASELYTGDELATELGLTAGTSQFSTEPWLKFMSEGKVLFVNKKPIRHTISWDDINAVDAVYGTRTITKDGYTYKVRLLTGAEADPGSVAGGEWNNLIYKVHVDDPSGSNWASYTDADLVVGAGDGRANWTQETDASDTSSRVYRGTSSLTHFSATTSSTSNSNYGFRCALELVA